MEFRMLILLRLTIWRKLSPIFTQLEFTTNQVPIIILNGCFENCD